MRQRALRFVVATVGLWIASRGYYLVVGDADDILRVEHRAAGYSVEPTLASRAFRVTARPAVGKRPINEGGRIAIPQVPTLSMVTSEVVDRRPSLPAETADAEGNSDTELSVRMVGKVEAAAFRLPAAEQPSTPPQSFRPLSSAWLLARGKGGAQGLATNGQLGGSQVGARLKWPLIELGPSTRLGANLRISSPLSAPRGKEAALGVSMARRGALPLELIIERRFDIDGDGRNAFALTAVAGLDDRRLRAGWTVSAYGQVGVVGIKARDKFADGALRIEHSFTHRSPDQFRFGFGVWAAAQPGVSRVDVGPRIARRINAGPIALVAAAEWRQRVAGNASPGSGPTVSIGGDF